jgi:hypothetical protein
LRHMVVVLMSKLPDDEAFDALVEGADRIDSEERFARRAAAYRNELDAIAIRARNLRRLQDRSAT